MFVLRIAFCTFCTLFGLVTGLLSEEQGRLMGSQAPLCDVKNTESGSLTKTHLKIRTKRYKALSDYELHYKIHNAIPNTLVHPKTGTTKPGTTKL